MMKIIPSFRPLLKEARTTNWNKNKKPLERNAANRRWNRSGRGGFPPLPSCRYVTALLTAVFRVIAILYYGMNASVCRSSTVRPSVVTVPSRGSTTTMKVSGMRGSKLSP